MSNLLVPTTGEAYFLGQIKAALDVAIAATKLKVRLYSNNYVPIPSSVVGDFTEADFTGYTAGGMVVPPTGAVFINSDNQAEFDCTTTNVWTATDAVTPNTIFGPRCIGPACRPFAIRLRL